MPFTPHVRAMYPHHLPIQTRWRDNDVYGHVNNVVYYSYFDTVINRWLIDEGGLDIAAGAAIGVCVESRCRYLRSVAFPETLAAGLRVVHLGRASVRYEAAIFSSSSDEAAAQGDFVHVFVDRATNRPVDIPPPLRAALQRLLVTEPARTGPSSAGPVAERSGVAAGGTVALVQVDGGDERLLRLLQLYIHEWSGMIEVPIREDALYAYAELPLYRDRDTRAAFLFVDTDAAIPLGFALASRDASACWHVKDFFVIAGARRRGVGKLAAEALLAARPGRWTLTVRPENPGALGFWRKVCPDAEERVEVGEDGVRRTRLSLVA